MQYKNLYGRNSSYTYARNNPILEKTKFSLNIFKKVEEVLQEKPEIRVDMCL